MPTWRVNNATVLGNFACGPWVANRAYALGDRVVCRTTYSTVARRAYVYECTTAGTSHATTEPTWPTSGTVADGPDTLVWTTRQANDGDWANATAYIGYILNYGGIAAGDTVLVHYEHSETWGWSTTGLAKGGPDATQPLLIYSVDKADDSLRVGAICLSNDATYGGRFTGYAYSWGITWGATASIVSFYNSSPGEAWTFESDGTVTVLKSTGAFRMDIGPYNYPCVVKVLNSNIEFSNVAGFFNGGCDFTWRKGTLIAANGVTKLFSGGRPFSGKFRIEDVDLSASGRDATAASLVEIGNPMGDVLFSRCKLSADAGFTLKSGSWTAPSGTGRLRLHHCSAANKTYDFHEACLEGTVEDEATIVKTSGASDGTTAIAHKMVASASAAFNYPLIGVDIQGWTAATVSTTFTVEGIWDSETNIQNDEIWMELECPANNADGLGAMSSNRMAPGGTAADVAASTVDWTTTGLTNPNKFKLSVTVTPGKAGPITARICLAKPSTTVYIDPRITES